MALEYLSHLARLGAADIHPGTAMASAALVRALSPAAGQRILEIGCGTGATLVRVASRADVFAVGMDLLPEMLAQARRRVRRSGLESRIALTRGSMAAIPFKGGYFDAVYCESVLGFQTTETIRATLHEIFRVLKAGGRLVANEAIWKPGIDSALVRRLNHDCQRDFGLPQATEEAWDAADWQEALRKAGFLPQSVALLESLYTACSSVSRKESGRSGSDQPATIRSVSARLSPSLLVQKLRYRRLLRAYRPMNDRVEGRLFVALRA